jgi:hypothetical protein
VTGMHPPAMRGTAHRAEARISRGQTHHDMYNTHTIIALAFKGGGLALEWVSFGHVMAGLSITSLMGNGCIITSCSPLEWGDMKKG